jgi:hypothetical protein
MVGGVVGLISPLNSEADRFMKRLSLLKALTGFILLLDYLV